MIRLSFGSVGSGKSASEVRNLFMNPSNRMTYSNIATTGLKNNIKITPEMIIKTVQTGEKKKRDGTIEIQNKLVLNTEFWKSIPKPINIVIDEAHTIMNSRRAMSKINLIMGDFLALMRRILGSNDAGEGEAVFITQLPRRFDPITREMATEIRHHKGHYQKICLKCKIAWNEDSDMPERLWSCPRCGSFEIKKRNHVIEILKFQTMQQYYDYLDLNRKTFYSRYFIKDIEKIFNNYDTLQWDDMFSDFY